jgi:hypothetical protein
MTRILTVLFIALAITACGVRGDPQPPQFTQSQ